MKWVSAVLCVALLSGCFGYNSSSKGWAYVGDSILIVGGGAAIGYDVTQNKPEACEGTSCPYHSQIRGGMVVGAVLVAAGLFGIIFNATRDNVKTSR
ncbi:MAG: hypothetical protein QM831_15700 [Kofleriaceae bacterium]